MVPANRLTVLYSLQQNTDANESDGTSDPEYYH